METEVEGTRPPTEDNDPLSSLRRELGLQSTNINQQVWMKVKIGIFVCSKYVCIWCCNSSVCYKNPCLCKAECSVHYVQYLAFTCTLVYLAPSPFSIECLNTCLCMLYIGIIILWCVCVCNCVRVLCVCVCVCVRVCYIQLNCLVVWSSKLSHCCVELEPTLWKFVLLKKSQEDRKLIHPCACWS